MFTIKVMHGKGHVVYECAHYQFICGELDDRRFPTTISRLVLDGGSEPWHIVPIGKDTVYVMNAAGKTVDQFHPYTPDDPLRWAVEPEIARATADHNPAAAAYIGAIGQAQADAG